MPGCPFLYGWLMCVTPQNNTREVSGSWIKILPWDVHLVMWLPEEGGRGGRKYIKFWALFWIQWAKIGNLLIFKYDSWLYSLIVYSQNMLKSSIAKTAASKVSAIIACYCFCQCLGCSHPILPNVSCWLARPIVRRMRPCDDGTGKSFNRHCFPSFSSKFISRPLGFNCGVVGRRNSPLSTKPNVKAKLD